MANKKEEVGVMKIIILHGWVYDLGGWGSLVSMLEKEGFEAEMLKIPGLTAKSDEVWDLNKYCSWLDKTIEKEGEKVTLLGHSNGGKLALSYTLKHPDKVDKLILIDSAGIYHKELKLRIKRAIFKFLANTGKKITKSEKLRSLLYKLAREKDYREAPLNMRRTMADLISVDLTDELKKIKTPTLIIWGEKDKLTPLKDAYLMKEKIKNSKLCIVKSAGHAPIYSHTEKVAKLIGEFLKHDI